MLSDKYGSTVNNVVIPVVYAHFVNDASVDYFDRNNKNFTLKRSERMDHGSTQLSNGPEGEEISQFHLSTHFSGRIFVRKYGTF